MITWIYFALIDGNRIKIGKTNNLLARMKQHSKSTLAVHDVRFLAAVQGVAADERHVQRFFVSDAASEMLPENGSSPEMFYVNPNITNYIRWLRNQGFVTYDLNDIREQKVTFDIWEPREERQVPPPYHPLFPADFSEFNDPIVTGDDYYTSEIILDCARECLGGEIDLDPASHPVANMAVKATRFYSIHDNGLEQPWGGRVWINPPFSQWKHWVPKIISEYASGRVKVICVLAAMRTATEKYFRPLLDASSGMCIVTGRTAFRGKGENSSPNDGHCVFYLGNDAEKFLKSFQGIGCVWHRNAGNKDHSSEINFSDKLFF